MTTASGETLLKRTERAWGYAYSLKNQLSDKEKLGGKLSDEETTKIEEVGILSFSNIVWNNVRDTLIFGFIP